MYSFKNTLKFLVISLSFVFTIFSSPLYAGEGPTYVDKKGYAIKGYDSVAYFTEQAPVKGDKAISYEWNHGVWLFSSTANRDLFKEAPEKYAPQYGGYCAYGVAKGSFAKIDPKQWTILDGKLYLNYNKRINKRWVKKQDEYIETGDKNWFSELLGEAKANVAN